MVLSPHAEQSLMADVPIHASLAGHTSPHTAAASCCDALLRFYCIPATPGRDMADNQVKALGPKLPDGVKIMGMRGGDYTWAKDDSSDQRLLGPHGLLRSRLEVKEGLATLQQELAEAGQPLVTLIKR